MQKFFVMDFDYNFWQSRIGPSAECVFKALEIEASADQEIFTVSLQTMMSVEYKSWPVPGYLCCKAKTILKLRSGQVDVGAIVYIEELRRFCFWMPVPLAAAFDGRMTIADKLFLYPEVVEAAIILDNLDYFIAPLFEKQPSFPEVVEESGLLQAFTFFPLGVREHALRLDPQYDRANKAKILVKEYDPLITNFPFNSIHAPFYLSMILVYRIYAYEGYEGKDNTFENLANHSITVFEKCSNLIESLSFEGHLIPDEDITAVYRGLSFAHGELGEFALSRFYIERWNELAPSTCRYESELAVISEKELLGAAFFKNISKRHFKWF